ncbi:hypothetical protein [Erwinia phyllosphaerae]|uniref:hypothetical protein n=1 Tax=Erwinia phyllosphaerae TaxID=2853256 RepID=UPI001FEDB2A8|nr:hypothetical protein [Erwinia phyllosphaerae]MBV4366743.1 hypothetical protein [Erwinia phyllosphaerae]
MKKNSYTLKHNKTPDDIKKHKALRGLRCYVSSYFHHKHRIHPDSNTCERITEVINKMSSSGKNVALLSYCKARHSAIIFCERDTWSIVSAYGDGVVYYGDLCHEQLVDIIYRESTGWKDTIKMSNVVYIGGLNIISMEQYINEFASVNKFKIFTNNCSRFAANVLIAGSGQQKGFFTHDRPCQMPANTLELAKEIDRFLQKRRGIVR